MFNMKFMDGTPVPQDYRDKISKLVEAAARASEEIGEDELERYAALGKERMSAVYCQFNPVVGWQALKVEPIQGTLPVRIVHGMLRITTRQQVRGGQFVNPKKLINEVMS